MSSGSAPRCRARRIHSTSPSDPSGPGSKTYNADTRPSSTALRNDAMSGSRTSSPTFPGTRPKMRAPFTFGASTGGTLNLASAGCGFSRYRHTTLTPFVSPRSSSVSRRKRKSSSWLACADSRKRTLSGFDRPAAASRSSSFALSSLHDTGSSAAFSDPRRSSGFRTRSSPSIQ